MKQLIYKTFKEFDNSIFNTTDYIVSHCNYGDRYTGTVDPNKGILYFKTSSGAKRRVKTNFKTHCVLDLLKIKNRYFLLDVLEYKDLDIKSMPFDVRHSCKIPEEILKLERIYQPEDYRSHRDMVIVRPAYEEFDYWKVFYRYPIKIGFIKSITKNKIFLAIIKKDGIIHGIGGIPSIGGVTPEMMLPCQSTYIGRVVEATILTNNVISARFRDDLLYTDCKIDPRNKYNDY